MLESFFDSDEFVIFQDNGYGNIVACKLTCFNENSTLFIRNPIRLDEFSTELSAAELSAGKLSRRNPFLM